MKDCATCDDRVELNPKYKRMKWENLPCSTCKPWEPTDDDGHKRIDIKNVPTSELPSHIPPQASDMERRWWEGT